MNGKFHTSIESLG